ncbi:hypothetical protein J2754_001491 [Halarchaeum solikamskense]|nr:hypothetical protein [Halarchaeum solikamskense]
MHSIDERILEHIYDEGKTTPDLMGSLRMFRSHQCILEDRCRVLSQAGYLRPDERGSSWYVVTEGGIAYLDGRMRADAIHPPPDARRPGHVLG